MSKYLETLSATQLEDRSFWFRGHRDLSWSLTPSALRFEVKKKRDLAISLLQEFRRVAELRLDRPPRDNEQLRWLQLAQHYGTPTRLLDWTENALFALYFACIGVREETDGIVFLFNPEHLSRLRGGKESSLEAHYNEDLIRGYFKLDGAKKRGGLPNVAINPVWNSERLFLQRGVFTLHGSGPFEIDVVQAPSLVGVPILQEHKIGLRDELDRLGVDEMTLFPELEHACNYLRWSRGL